MQLELQCKSLWLNYNDYYNYNQLVMSRSQFGQHNLDDQRNTITDMRNRPCHNKCQQVDLYGNSFPFSISGSLYLCNCDAQYKHTFCYICRQIGANCLMFNK